MVGLYTYHNKPEGFEGSERHYFLFHMATIWLVIPLK